jgi:hypothetical protein
MSAAQHGDLSFKLLIFRVQASGVMQIKCEQEIREISPSGIVSFIISQKLLCGERQRQ